MAIPCNGFTAQTVSTTQNTLGCTGETGNLLDNELPEELFLLTVLDALKRLAPDTFAAYTECEGVEVARNAFCAVRNITPSFQNSPAKVKAAILWMLNEDLCA